MTNSRKIRAMIVDDERLIRNELRYMLTQHTDLEVCCETGEASQVMEMIESERPDVVFLDIHLQTINGIVLAERINKGDVKPLIVLATAYTDYAVKGFEIGVIDYLVKPFEVERIKRCYERIKQAFIGTGGMVDIEQAKVALFEDGRYKLVDFDEIIFIEYSEGGLIIHTKDTRHRSTMSMKAFEHRCNDPIFMRIHKSFIINTDHIVEIIPWFNATLKLIMEAHEDKEIIVSRSYAKILKKKFGI